MRRLLVSVMAVTFIFGLASVVNASSVGGDIPEKGELAVGFETNFMTKREVKDVTQNQSAELKSNQYLATLAYGLLDRLALKVKLGAGDLRYKDADEKQVTEEGFLWGIGLDSKVYENEENGLKLLLGAEYFSAGDLDVKSRYLDPNDTLTFEDWREWQISFLVAKDIARFMPYLGVKYSDFEMDYKWYDSSAGTTTTGKKIEADKNFGVFLGTDYRLGENWKLNLEGRFIDETAMSFAGTYKF